MAAPALAVTGALAAAGPQALAATATAHQVTPTGTPAAAKTTAIHLDAVVQRADHAAVQQADQPTRTYTVRLGNTLAGIAQDFYGHASDWQYLDKINKSQISDPNLIYPGEVLTVPADPPASVRNGTYRSRHAASTTASASTARATQVSQSGSTQSSSSSSGSSSADLSSAVQQDIADGNNLLAIGQYLVANGYSDAAAAGVASCIDGESGGNPESVGSGGGGLIGWTPLGSAAPNPNIITGNVEQDMMTQLADIVFYNSNEIGQSAVDQLNSISDPVQAADFYSQQFERPAVTDSDVVESVAEQVYSELTS